MRGQASLRSDSAFAELKAFVIGVTGLAYYETRDAILEPLIERRIRESGAASCAAYRVVLERDAQELEALVGELTIGETHFFRHAELFHLLGERIIPEWSAEQHRSQVRVWSAGCSIGAEAYTFSILLRRSLGSRNPPVRISIVGTDINPRFLQKARRARFAEWAMRGADEHVRASCFRRDGNDWCLRDEYRAGVSFQLHNLVHDPVGEGVLQGLDLIACRNVMIYFSDEVVAKTYRRLHSALADGGWLLIGHADPAPPADLGLVRVDASGVVLYRRPSKPAPVEMPARPAQSLAPRPKRPRAVVRAVRLPARTDELAELRARCDAGAWSEAAQRCDTLLRSDPMCIDAYYMRALAGEQLDDVAGAEQDLRRVLYLAPDHALANFQLGRLAAGSGRDVDAMRLMETAYAALDGREDTERVAAVSDLTVEELRRLLRAHGVDADA